MRAAPKRYCADLGRADRALDGDDLPRNSLAIDGRPHHPTTEVWCYLVSGNVAGNVSGESVRGTEAGATATAISASRSRA